MNVIGTVANAAVVAAVGFLIMWQLRGRFDAADKRFDGIDRRFESIDRRFESIDRRFDALETRVDQRIDGLRSDITQIALAVGARPRGEEARP
jgi:hypothetical protein